MPYPALKVLLNGMFNSYCSATRRGHTWQDYMSAETTAGPSLDVENAIFA